MKIEQKDTWDLKAHPVNAELYGKDPDPELVKSIKAIGVLVPLTILPDGTVVSGHRRWQAAQQAGLNEVPVFVRTDLVDADDIEEALIESNRQREKTTEQRAREASRLMSIESRRAATRKQETQAKPGQKADERRDSETGTQSLKVGEKSNFGRSADKVGEAVGMSGRTVTKAVEVVKSIDKAKAAGDTKTAEKLTRTLNEKGVAPALKEAKAAQAPKPAKTATEPKALDPVAVILEEAKVFSSVIHTIQVTAFQQFRALTESKAGVLIDDAKLQEVKAKLGNVVSAVKSCRPAGRCPYCQAKDGGCPACRHTGVVNDLALANAPKRENV